MSRAMTMQEFGSLVRTIRDYHSPSTASGAKSIKYIDPHIDMRDNTVFSIQFRGMGGEKWFHVMNECRDLPECLYDRCMNWLKTKEW